MKVKVITRKTKRGLVRMEVPALPGLVVEAATREEALAGLGAVMERRLASRAFPDEEGATVEEIDLKDTEFGWPDDMDELARQAREEYARGETVPLEEVFAEAAGMDKDAWLQHVREQENARPKESS
jgi:hypothetical protein